MSEQLAAKLRAEIRASEEGKPKGTLDSLKGTAKILNYYAVECFPANDKGQVHFVRAIMEVAADEITEFLKKTEGKDGK